MISARSGAHSFDASQMNMSHVISHLSFGKKISPRLMSDVKRILPYLGGSHDRLNGRAYISQHGDSNANVTVRFPNRCISSISNQVHMVMHPAIHINQQCWKPFYFYLKEFTFWLDDM